MAGSEQRYRLNRFGYGAHQAVLELVGRPNRVLDVGCGSGHLAELLVSRGCRVVGIESDPAAAANARVRGVDAIAGDVRARTSLTLLRERGPYDVVVCADVLEHVPDPERVLAELVVLLASGGRVVASIPNVVSLRARLRLMAGIWRYEDVGIFDRTHLRFFSVATAEQLLVDAGLHIEGRRYVGPLSHRLGRTGSKLTALRPGLLANQVVLVGRSQ